MTIIYVCLARTDSSTLQSIPTVAYILSLARTRKAAQRICAVSILLAVVRAVDAFIDISASSVHGRVFV